MLKQIAMDNLKSRRKIKRTTAQTLLEGVLSRALEINRSKEYGVFIDRIYVFGSFINSKKTRLGDLDLGVETSPKGETPEENRAIIRYFERESKRKYQSKIFLEHILWFREKALRKLKNRSGFISLHDMTAEDGPMILKTGKLVFSRKTLKEDKADSDLTGRSKKA